MAVDLNGFWQSFVKDKNGLWTIRKDKYYITHKNTNLYVFGSCGFTGKVWRMWSNVGISTNLQNVELTDFEITWCDRIDSQGYGLNKTHEY